MYDISEHRHRFAVWTAARAAQRGLLGGSNAVMQGGVERSGIREFISSDASASMNSADEFDLLHRTWCRRAIEAMQVGGAPEATYGRAAKLIAVYIKTMVVMQDPDSDLSRIAHPPVDGFLLDGLRSDSRFSSSSRRLWRSAKRWTRFDETTYFEVIESFRAEGLDRPAFWAIERYWTPTGHG